MGVVAGAVEEGREVRDTVFSQPCTQPCSRFASQNQHTHPPPTFPPRRVWRLAEPAGHARLADCRLLHRRRAADCGVAARPRLQAVVCGAAGGLCLQVRPAGLTLE